MAKKDKRRLVDKVYDALSDIVAKQLVTDDFGTIRFVKRGDAIISQGTREALNRSDTVKTYVKATHWFESFWFYVNIKMKKNTEGGSDLPFISITFFQDIDGVLKQLFRAEWDNFYQMNHPQPHWHVTTSTEDSFEDFIAKESVDEDNPFAALKGGSKRLEVPKIHFAMAGGWHGGIKNEMIIGFTDEQQIANWMNNLFDHVREELVYAYH